MNLGLGGVVVREIALVVATMVFGWSIGLAVDAVSLARAVAAEDRADAVFMLGIVDPVVLTTKADGQGLAAVEVR
jgi:hypothetical protein